MHFNIFSEGICGKVGIFHNGKNPIEVFLFKLPLDVGDQPGLIGASFECINHKTNVTRDIQSPLGV